MNKLIVSLVLGIAFAGGGAAQAQSPAPQTPQAQRAAPNDVDPNSMLNAALQVAQLIDAGRSGEIWDGSSEIAKRTVNRDAFVKQIATGRAAFGQPVSRVWASVIRQVVPAPQAGQAPPAGSPPPGAYITVRFATRFSGGQSVGELVSFRLDENGTWRVAGYTIQ